MLFLIYVNDLSNVIENCKYQLYADDTVIYFTGNDLNASTNMNNIKLDKVSSYKYLGIQFEANLNFHKYLQDCIQRATYKIHMLAKIRSYIDFNSALTIYKTMILSIFEYGDIAYDQADIKSLCSTASLVSSSLGSLSTPGFDSSKMTFRFHHTACIPW